MSHLEDARFTLLRAVEKAQGIGGMLNSALMELAEVKGLILEAGQGGNSDELTQGSLGMYHAGDEMEEALGILRRSVEQIEQFAGRL